jgi:hypothetical protein
MLQWIQMFWPTAQSISGAAPSNRYRISLINKILTINHSSHIRCNAWSTWHLLAASSVPALHSALPPQTTSLRLSSPDFFVPLSPLLIPVSWQYSHLFPDRKFRLSFPLTTPVPQFTSFCLPSHFLPLWLSPPQCLPVSLSPLRVPLFTFRLSPSVCPAMRGCPTAVIHTRWGGGAGGGGRTPGRVRPTAGGSEWLACLHVRARSSTLLLQTRNVFFAPFFPVEINLPYRRYLAEKRRLHPFIFRVSPIPGSLPK